MTPFKRAVRPVAVVALLLPVLAFPGAAGAVPSLAVDPTTVPSGGTVTATWSGIASPTTTDWIGLYVPGSGVYAYIEWIYVSCTQTPAVARASGACLFRLPGLTAGTYELRLYANDGYAELAKSNTFAVAAVQPEVQGRWSRLPDLPYFPVHVHLLPSGKVMMYPGDGGISGDDPRLWDPATGSTTPLARAGYDLFCSGHTFLADGRLFVSGGHISNTVGLPTASIYDPTTNTWTRLPNMNAGRWYPTNTTLANGDVLVVSGYIDQSLGTNPLPQVFQMTPGTWRDLTSAELGLELYPRMHLAPNGAVFAAGPTQQTRYLHTSGTGAWTHVADGIFDFRDYGTSVMYDVGKVLAVGGGVAPPTNTAEVIDLTATTPAWRTTGSMTHARRQLNATILPDGTVLVTGGTSSSGFNDPELAVFAAELWDPATDRWTSMASAMFRRLYHSAALLLPDGRVLTTGGNGYLTPEAYEPPYLFKGARPTITSAPTTVTLGQSFVVQTPAAVAQVTLVRHGSVTHAFDMNQRFMRLGFSPTVGGVTVTLPSNANVVPPGHYMVFLLNGDGVPSVARTVRIGTAASNVPPTAAAGGPYSGVTGRPVTFSGAGSSDPDGTIASYKWTFGDGTTGTGVEPTKTYTAAGTYSVTLTVTDDKGAKSSNTVTGTIALGPPTAPNNPKATNPRAGQVKLTWSDRSNNEAGFAVERSSNGSTFTEIARVGANVQTCTNTGVTQGTWYYRIRAFNAAGYSAYSGTVNITTN